MLLTLGNDFVRASFLLVCMCPKTSPQVSLSFHSLNGTVLNAGTKCWAKKNRGSCRQGAYSLEKETENMKQSYKCNAATMLGAVKGAVHSATKILPGNST